MVVYRICSAKRARHAFTGEGARRSGGRWNERGTRVVYCSGSIALAMLEVLVHTPTLPKNMVTFAVTLPNDLEFDDWTRRRLPASWANFPVPAGIRALGNRWVTVGRTLALKVPSAVVPGEWNLLINPSHPDFRRIEVGSPKAVAFDARLKR
ncbi:MAG TPA: RES family NAD+ phosphorylase [Polyangiaceae bacterium]|nr:RES family NAD+ phosphorylase [Polyangiaceae bacterium]